MTRAELIEALKSAKGPDIELEHQIALFYTASWDYSVDWRGWGYDENGNAIQKPKAFPYMSSLDAAITLVEMVRPGWSWQVCVNEQHQYPQAVMACSHPKNRAVYTEAATPAIALIIALLESEGE